MIKIIVERSYYTGEEVSGKGVLRAELIADTAAELAGVTEVGGNVLDFGSIAHAIDDAQILRLDSSGDWRIQTGDDAGKTVDEVVAATSVQSSPKSVQGEQRKNDGIGLEGIDLEKVLNGDEEDEEEPTSEEKDEREPLPEIDEPIDEKGEKKEVAEPEPEPERKESGELKEVSGDDKSE